MKSYSKLAKDFGNSLNVEVPLGQLLPGTLNTSLARKKAPLQRIHVLMSLWTSPRLQ
jgi:hypothetical protein